jgi:hypothetical protein
MDLAIINQQLTGENEELKTKNFTLKQHINVLKKNSLSGGSNSEQDMNEEDIKCHKSFRTKKMKNHEMKKI